MKQEKELKQLLTGQKFVSSEYDLALLESTKTYARAYARATEGGGVVSDFHNSVCYIYMLESSVNIFSVCLNIWKIMRRHLKM